MWKEKARPAIERALGHTDFVIEDGKVIGGEGLPGEKDLHRIVGVSLNKERAVAVATRKAQLEHRQIGMKDFKEALRLADVVIVQAMQRFGGSLPDEITAKDDEALAWGHWIRDMKRAIDAGQAELIALPPLPSWLVMNPGISRLCETLGVSRASTKPD